MTKCLKCGKNNDADSDFCESCGASLKQVNTKQELKSNPKQQTKSPIVACLLNLLIAGAGFAYLGKWGKAALFFFMVVLSGAFFTIAGGLAMMAITMILCYSDAKKMNAMG